uniref:C2 domain-containing protein n=1 Tax=Ascaris lumbricoides TaxID=6252 RepID=A0A0M3IKF3_ASCLU
MGFDSLPIYKINHGPVHSASQAECMMSTPTEPLTSYCRFRSVIGTESLRPNAGISLSDLSSEHSEAEKIIEEDEVVASPPYNEERVKKKDFRMERIVVDSPKDNIKESFEVRVHVIGAEIQQHGLTEREINVSLRVYLAGQCRSVLTHSGTATPRWNETLSFTVEKELIDLRETELEFKMYGVGGLFRRDRLWGSFVCDLYTIYRSDGHCIVRKWFPLTSALSSKERSAENDYEGMSDLCGFLKMSVCVRRLHHADANIDISFFEDTTDDEREMVFTESLLHHTMTVRVYKLCQLDPGIIHYDHPHTYLIVQVQVGKEEAYTHAVKATSESVSVNEEIYLRLLWPTVARKVIFRILGKNRSEALAEAVLNLKQCQGDDECGRFT